jgi:hypothetical protein
VLELEIKTNLFKIIDRSYPVASSAQMKGKRFNVDVAMGILFVLACVGAVLYYVLAK